VNAGFFPLDEQLGVRDAHWSEKVAADAVWLYGHVTGAVAAQALKRLAQVDLSESSLWRRVETWGPQIQAYENIQQATANAMPLRGDAPPTALRLPYKMGVGMDGTMVHIRKEGWKELKVGDVFEIEVRPEWVAESETLEDRAHAIHNSYVALLGGPEGFGRAVWAEAVRRRVPQAHDSLVMGDGANWIWNLAHEHFGDSWQVVDWYHAKQHLHKVGDLVFGEGSPMSQQWVKTTRTPLYQGHAYQVAQTIQELAEEYPQHQKALHSEAGYFESNKRRMQYMEVRDAGLPIGSGMVESGCKQFGARFNGAGMRWSREGAERLIPIRAAILSGRFDEVWHAAYNSPLN
jgi:hypothetical protein